MLSEDVYDEDYLKGNSLHTAAAAGLRHQANKSQVEETQKHQTSVFSKSREKNLRTTLMT